MVHFRTWDVTAELLRALLATRSTSALQSVEFPRVISDPEIPALAGELVGTDPHKQWKYTGEFGNAKHASAFCAAAANAHGTSSLTALDLSVFFEVHPALARLFAATPRMTSFKVSVSIKNLAVGLRRICSALAF